MKRQIIPPYTMAAVDEEFTQLLTKINANKSLADRIDHISAYFMGRDYLRSALGEGVEGYFDQNPLYRSDQFDCLTYVNTVLALARAQNLIEFQHELLCLNYYDAKPDYAQRFHFMELDWNVQLIQQGIIEEITSTILMDQSAEIAEALIDKPAWFGRLPLTTLRLLAPLSVTDAERRLAELHALAQYQQQAVSKLAYIPLTTLLAATDQAKCIIEQIPHACIIEIVRPNWDLRQQIGTHLTISHLGFCLWQDNQLWFRHASEKVGRVVTVLLAEYLQACLLIPSIGGIAVMRPL